MKRVLILFCLLLLTSCSKRQIYSPLSSPHRFCPGFAKPTWQPVKMPLENSQQLVDKQKFAITPKQHTLWFSSGSDRLGLCIPPTRSFRRAINDCGTSYATYVKKEQEWELLEQTVTICPS